MSTSSSEKYWTKLLALSTIDKLRRCSTISAKDQAWVQEAINEVAQVEDPITYLRPNFIGHVAVFASFLASKLAF
ncbi:hypothetical protein L596_000561 [Steinernema carpocapsae]|uniref:Uncharacterized protein n=1 Tax=Steinernema carpocapsae TaxID=34508 RepID=A0A4U8UJV2_STECR|nr:hypothetical protein L596_000561 [Steinernema carpocapsae]